jgi:hypothetical protein
MLIGYHGTRAVSQVLRDGLSTAACRSQACKHICFSSTPELAAMFAIDADGAMCPDGGIVIVDNLEEFGVPEFVGNEARTHVDIPPERVRLLETTVVPSMDGHVDPGLAYPPVNNHPHCWERLPSGRKALGLAD